MPWRCPAGPASGSMTLSAPGLISDITSSFIPCMWCTNGGGGEARTDVHVLYVCHRGLYAIMLACSFSCGGPMAIIIGVVSQKGGVGKSTIARLVAREFAAQGWQVKIGDLD